MLTSEMVALQFKYTPVLPGEFYHLPCLAHKLGYLRERP